MKFILPGLQDTKCYPDDFATNEPMFTFRAYQTYSDSCLITPSKPVPWAVFSSVILFSIILSNEVRADQKRVHSDRQLFSVQHNPNEQVRGGWQDQHSSFAMNGWGQESGEEPARIILPAIRQTIDPARQEIRDEVFAEDQEDGINPEDPLPLAQTTNSEPHGQLVDIVKEDFADRERSGSAANENTEQGMTERQQQNGDLRWGIFLVRPQLFFRSTFSDNIHQDHTKQSDFGTELETHVQVVTDLSRHELAFDGTVLKSAFRSSGREETLDYTMRVDGRLDVTSRQAIEGGLAITRENGSGGQVTNDENRFETAAHLGLRQRFNRLNVSLRGELLDHDDRNSVAYDYREFGGRIAAIYELRSGNALESEASLHIQEGKVGAGTGGLRSKARIATVLAGIEIANGQPVQGRLRLGYGWREDEDPLLGTLGGVILEGDLTWWPTRLTMLQLTGNTEMSNSSVNSDGTAMEYLLSLNLNHALTRHFLLSARVDSEFIRYQDTGNWDHTLVYSLSGEVEVSRHLAFVGTASHKTFNSMDGLRDYRENQISLAMRVKP